MKRILFILMSGSLLFSCGNEPKSKVTKTVSEVTIETILSDSLLSFRAIEILDDGNLAFAGSQNSYGLYNTKDKSLSVTKQKMDSLEMEFRAVAHTSADFFMLSVGSPAFLFKTGDAAKMELVYTEAHENTFYDAMKFWNNKEGIAMGDPTNGCISIIITRDGGTTWKKVACDDLPKAKAGEAAFAASNTNIAIVDNHTWIATGGTASRILYSADKGATWEIFETPIIQGAATTGIYSLDFYDTKNGFAIGGDYTKADANSANKIRTKDGGKTWELVAKDESPGYRSCVQYVPNSDAKELVTVGFKGIDYSKDSGNTWTHLSDEGFYTIRFLNDSTAFAAGKGRIAKLKF
ncbi:oxidoreductase [Subsaximicrobium wynnwilliamsii]|uniref:Oxidoreductase n=1 Tax=Subsaximicrobium wynnwilliamsii TaxID=291179 RepID=A0A5C6ZJX0_9FLAO|nr:oxidoreductase [Subsaximicrobium wynnwilliamsii]TXD84833.1 oxidoreductase [Subsaximicrobium wynnwilliamsii]TXD90504.1 oxidoreductase [Subsaximicrobium wynnwilliamsii]TXE04979.1 oxidoreductase [Subsaximicrobium wynnwilliamsii]